MIFHWYRWHRMQVIIHKLLMKIKVPLCRGHDGPCFHRGKKRRQRTAYIDDRLNWTFLCDKCMKCNHGYWDGMWNEYYS